MANLISGNCGLANCPVFLAGTANASTTADGSGNYSFTGLAAGIYFVIPQVSLKLPKSSWFSPLNQQVTIVASDVTGVNFTNVAAPALTQVWEKQGVVLTPGANQSPLGLLEPTVIYEGNAQILSGNVFKMWFSGGDTANSTQSIYYAESTDGVNWTQLGQASPVIVGHWEGRVHKSGSTYYGFYNVGGIGGTIDRYTSADGVHWTKTNSGVLALGSAGSWDSHQIYNPEIFNDDGVTWSMWYGANAGGTVGGLGLATSTNQGVTWIKFAGNPVIANFDSTKTIKVGNTLYVWGNSTVFGDGGTFPFQFPTDLYRGTVASNFQSVVLTGASLQRTRSFETTNTGNAQINSPAIVEVNGKSYMFYGCTASGAASGSGFQIALATTNQPISQVVKQAADSGDLPIQLASDNFQRGSLGANWTQASHGGMTIASNVAVPATTGAVDGASYNAITWPNDQYSEVTAGTGFKAGAGANFIFPLCRVGGTPAAPTYYVAFVENSGTVFIEKTVAGTTTNLTNPAITITVNDGDVYRLEVVGTTITFYQNGIPIQSQTDASITSGPAGMGSQAAATASLAPISLWAGGAPGYSVQGSLGAAGAGATISWSGPTSGSVTADANGNYNTNDMLVSGTYTITPSSGSATFSPANSSQTVTNADITGVNFTATGAYSVPDCRNFGHFPNASRSVQGALIYDVQTSSNPSVPGVDSRTAGAPVDSRAAGQAPQNSRTPGTYGPGVN